MYRISISKTAQKEMAALPDSQLLRINESILQLAENPRPSGCKKLKGFKDLYRIRIGSFRVVYSLKDKTLTIEILRVADRKDIYK